jgi:hypothetical protein
MTKNERIAVTLAVEVLAEAEAAVAKDQRPSIAVEGR